MTNVLRCWAGCEKAVPTLKNSCPVTSKSEGVEPLQFHQSALTNMRCDYGENDRYVNDLGGGGPPSTSSPKYCMLFKIGLGNQIVGFL